MVTTLTPNPSVNTIRYGRLTPPTSAGALPRTLNRYPRIPCVFVRELLTTSRPDMCRAVLLLLLLVLSSVPLSAQPASHAPGSTTVLRDEPVVPQSPGALLTNPIFRNSEPQPRLRLNSLLVGREAPPAICPDRRRRTFVGAALGAVLGGGIGYFYAWEAPNPGIGDLPLKYFMFRSSPLWAGLLAGALVPIQAGVRSEGVGTRN